MRKIKDYCDVEALNVEENYVNFMSKKAFKAFTVWNFSENSMIRIVSWLGFKLP
jgi:hypothetical protein